MLAVLLILLLVLRVLLVVAILNLDIIPWLTNTAAVIDVAVVGAPRYIAVAAIAEVETLLCEVEALIVGAGQIQAIDTAQV